VGIVAATARGGAVALSSSSSERKSADSAALTRVVAGARVTQYLRRSCARSLDLRVRSCMHMYDRIVLVKGDDVASVISPPSRSVSKGLAHLSASGRWHRCWRFCRF